MKIAQVLYAGSWGEVSPETIESGLGGRETAMIKLAEAWANKGHEVTNFVNVEKGRRFLGFENMYQHAYGNPEGYHEYLPIQMARPMLSNMPWDAVVSWEMPSIFKDEAIRENAKVKVCEMQVAHFPGDEIGIAGEYCDYVAALSDWHGKFLIHSGLEMKHGQVITLPNGVDLSRYPDYDFNKKINSYETEYDPKFVYSSSPDRGLWHLLKSWHLIRKNFPEAELQVCYGFDEYVSKMKWAHTRHAQMCVEMEELIKQPGVINCGKIGQSALATLQRKATAWLYPLDPLWPTETGCITAVENAAAGNPLIFCDADCLKDEFGGIGATVDLPFSEELFASVVTQVLFDEELYRQMAANGRRFAKTRTWEGISDQWIKLFTNVPS